VDSRTWKAFVNHPLQMLCNWHGQQLRAAPEVSERLDSVLGREPAHKQCKLGIGCHVDGSGINSLNIFGGATASVQSYNKFDGFHFVCPFGQNVNRGAVHFLEVEYTMESGLPHSKQLAFDRDVIDPQEGHILCDCDAANCNFGRRIQWNNTVVNSTMSRPSEILVAFMKATTLLGECTKMDGQAITR
jgi:hypothetical protein